MQNTNSTPRSVIMSMLLAAFSLFVNGFGVYLTFHAGLGANPWDVLHWGLSNTLGILYGTASIGLSVVILAIDIAMREQIGVAMFIDAVVVGKAVDFFNYIDIVPVPKTLPGGILMIVAGMFIIGYTQYLYMRSSLGCGPRDTLIVGVSRHLKKIPIGAVSICILGTSTLIGYLLGGPVGIGTLISAFCTGPIMQLAFHTVHFDATGIRHQNIAETASVLFKHNM